MTSPRLVLDPSARLPFVAPLVLANVAREKKQDSVDLSFEVNAPTALQSSESVEGALPVLRALASMADMMGTSDAEKQAVESFLTQSE